MKNLILICLLFVGVYSYASESVVIKKSNATENIVSLEQNVIENVDSLDDFYRCRADITYNGEYVTSTYGFGATADEACANARKAAADFIKAQE
ncbi:MAG: hypothetical protein PHW92_11645 [Lutibacter sp.]|nr:hypothetical protein [Lutibacter sp.]